MFGSEPRIRGSSLSANAAFNAACDVHKFSDNLWHSDFPVSEYSVNSNAKNPLKGFKCAFQ